MSPAARNASPRLMRVAISASEYWRPAGECAAADEVPVDRFSGLAVCIGSGGLIAEDDLVSVVNAVCGGWTIDCSSPTGLPSQVLTNEWRSAVGFTTTDGSTLAGLLTTVELIGGGVVPEDDLVSAVCTGSEFATP